MAAIPSVSLLGAVAYQATLAVCVAAAGADLLRLREAPLAAGLPSGAAPPDLPFPEAARARSRLEFRRRAGRLAVLARAWRRLVLRPYLGLQVVGIGGLMASLTPLGGMGLGSAEAANFAYYGVVGIGAVAVLGPAGLGRGAGLGLPGLALLRGRGIWRRHPVAGVSAWLLAALVATGGTWAIARHSGWGFAAGRPAEDAAQPNLLAPILLTIHALASAALLEEAVFRHWLIPAVQRWLRSRLPSARPIGIGLLACILSAVPFAVGHLGVIDPPWLKPLYMLALGTLLGMARLGLGTDAAIALHLLVNAAAVAMPGPPTSASH